MNEPNPNPNPAAAPAPPAESASAPAANPLHQAAVLVVDDSRTMRLALIRALTGLGFRNITEATNGRQALEVLERIRPDLILLDVMMPEMDGFEVCRRIKASTAWREIPIIFLTGQTETVDIVRGFELGAVDYVAKPFNAHELLARVKTHLTLDRLHREIEQQNAQLREASERIRRDLDAAARVQRAMLPRQNIVSAHARAAWSYEPTDELAGDALGLHLIDERYLAAYVIDVSGHGVPAALLSVTAMHYLDPEPGNASLLRDMTCSGGMGSVQRPSVVVTELNRRFSADNSGGRFLTMILCVLDTFEGRLSAASGGHPLPIVLRGQNVVPVPDTAGLPIAVLDNAEYEDLTVQLEPGDRVYLFSDGIVEQAGPAGGERFGQNRFTDLLIADQAKDLDHVVTHGIDALAGWAGARRFSDDVSLVALEWIK